MTYRDKKRIFWTMIAILVALRVGYCCAEKKFANRVEVEYICIDSK